ncbi:amidohydrolase [Lysinibacter sp. HNR]|uniref:amidohydrolase n=1 Tax=Lysinibacter sp. HNR TaxID=3031408 RepID=UPI0024352601|nr:amidohydrolase [Lysinibacter sp. HNR]WGD37857.1 amidohydrolase [Lysinibacter sp. HNR]
MIRNAKTIHLSNGVVWMGPGAPDQHELLIVGNRIEAVGADVVGRIAELERERGETAEKFVDRVDLEGGMIIPSFGEGHSHPIFGGLEARGPQIRACTSVEEIIDEVRRYAENNPDEEWILGASYDGSLAPSGLFDARWLDEAVPDRPVVLRAWDYHTVWCNTRALELAGIEANTPEPELGEIPRRQDGSPLGTLREWGAVDLVAAVNPGYSFDDRVAALARATEHFAALGVTWIQDAWVEPEDIDVYIEAALRGALATRVNLALLADPRVFPNSLEQMIAARQRIRELKHPLLTANSVKFFTDGVVENETGALLEPYCSGAHDHGMLVWDSTHLAESVAAVMAVGFQPHLHAIGDAAVRCALDAIEHSQSINGDLDLRPVIAHVQLASEEDLARFATLGVTANMQPLWAQEDALMTALTIPRLGQERADKQYQLKTLTHLGATLSFGSDWPCSSAAPFDGIAVATSRQTQQGQPELGWTPHQILDVETALFAYTAGTAHQAFADQRDVPWGQIARGSSADLVWLDADPRTTPPQQMPMIGIRATYLAGTVTFRVAQGAQ